MARPPDIDALGKLNFITNYFIAGCEPPLWLFLEFAQEPSQDLLLLFLLPDLTDIGQAIFDPQHGRRRKPGRHGRKKRRGPRFPDPSDVIGQRVRSVINPFNALKFGPVNWAFRIWNRFEAVAFTCAVIEGLADVGYEGILGILKHDPEHCTEFPRLVRVDEIPEVAGGAGPPIWPIRVSKIETAVGFATTEYMCQAYDTAYVVHFSATIRNDQIDMPIETSVALGKIGGGGRVTSGVATLGYGESITLTVAKNFEKGEPCEWGIGTRHGFGTVLKREVVAFGKMPIPWPF